MRLQALPPAGTGIASEFQPARLLGLIAAVAFTILGVVFATAPAEAQIDDNPQTFWGVEGIDPDTTTNVQSEVWAIEQVGNTIYVGGKFLQVTGNGSHDQPYLAAFHADTGRWIDWWRPALDGPVYALQASPDGKLFVGGEFTSINGQNAPAFAAIDPTTGNIVPGFTARVSGGAPAVVRDFDLEGDSLYVGGNFTTAANQGVQVPRQRAAKFDWSTGAVDPDLSLIHI